MDQRSTIRIAVVAGEEMRNELREKKTAAHVAFIFADKYRDLEDQENFSACFDLTFIPSSEQLDFYNSLNIPVFIHSMEKTMAELKRTAGENNQGKQWNLTRINAWPGFMGRPLIEITEPVGEAVEILQQLEWDFEITPDVPGFITARVISTIINEAYFAVEEKVSSKNEIDIAMKLGTNYPFGPFEWAEKIGTGNIYNLLSKMSLVHDRYIPCTMLKNETHR